MLLEEFLQQPGFIYEINGKYYFLGKWICKECTELDATDSVSMYQMCRNQQEEKETNMYFQKIRAYSDFALEVPYNPEKLNLTCRLFLKLFLMKIPPLFLNSSPDSRKILLNIANNM